MQVLLFTLLVLLLACSIQPGYANWWEDKQLWPTMFEPWQSYIVRQNEWNTGDIYVPKGTDFVAKQKEYGTYSHQGAQEAVRFFHKNANFYEVLSLAGYIRSAIAVRMIKGHNPGESFILHESFGVERCLVSGARDAAGGKVFNLEGGESEFFSKKEVEGLDRWRGPCKGGSFYTPLGGQYEQAALRLSQSPYKQPAATFPYYICRLPPRPSARKPDVNVAHRHYEILIPSEQNVYTQFAVLNHAIIERGLANKDEKYTCSGVIFHSGDNVARKLLSELSELYRKILSEKHHDKQHITTQIATFQWMFAHAMPYARGSAAVGTILSNAFYMYHNMEDAIRPTRVGVVVDIEALSTPLEAFLENYPTFFEGGPRGV